MFLCVSPQLRAPFSACFHVASFNRRNAQTIGKVIIPFPFLHLLTTRHGIETAMSLVDILLKFCASIIAESVWIAIELEDEVIAVEQSFLISRTKRHLVYFKTHLLSYFLEPSHAVLCVAAFSSVGPDKHTLACLSSLIVHHQREMDSAHLV